LVVIAIIAILAAILFPVFTSAKKRTQATTCASNMKQLAGAFSQYLQDYSKYPGGGPLGRFQGGGARGEWVWFIQDLKIKPYGFRCDVTRGSMFTYIKNIKVYQCPSDVWCRTTKANGSYAMNGYLDWAYDYNACGKATGVTEAAVRRPSKCPLLIDEGLGCTTKNQGYLYPGMCDGWFIDWCDEPYDNHLGGCDMAFCDGHVSIVTHNKYGEINYTPEGNRIIRH